MTLLNRSTMGGFLLLTASIVAALGLMSLSRGPASIAADHADPAPTTLLFGTSLTGGGQPARVETEAVGAFALEAAGGVATYTLALSGIGGATQAHIHQGVSGANGDIVAFLLSSEPAASGDLTVEGTLRASDLVGPLTGDWSGFLADLEAGNLYVNVHTEAHRAGELRGSLIANPSRSLRLPHPVPAGASLLGWSGLDTDSRTVLTAGSFLAALWWLGPEGWVVDSATLPSPLRNNIVITRGTGLVVIATEDTFVFVPVARVGSTINAVMAAAGGSGVSGVATLVPEGSGVRVRVAVRGLSSGSHANHVHHGSCADQGAIHVPLTDLVAEANGDAAASTSWSADPSNHFLNRHYVAIHEFSTADGIGAVIACGDLERRRPLTPGAPDQQGPTEGTVQLRDFDGYDFSKGALQEGGGDFYVDVDGRAEPKFFANNAGQLGLIDLGDLGSAALDSVVIPADGFSSGVSMVEGNTYVAQAVEAEVDHFIIFRIVDLRLGEYVELEFLYR